MERIIDAALNDLERGLAAASPSMDVDARSFLLRAANGDAPIRPSMLWRLPSNRRNLKKGNATSPSN